MDQIRDLLGKYSPDVPPEVTALKQYIDEHFHATASIGLTTATITITVTSASLANALRLHLPQLQAAAKTDKRLVFRIA